MSVASVTSRLSALQFEFREELIAIADWWLANTIDREHGGFFGEVSENNLPVKDASKGIILNARILWFFSEAAVSLGSIDSKATECRHAAKRAYDYIVNYFFDDEHGGVYWELDSLGNPINTKKQVYAQAFTIYALTAYYHLTQDEQALAYALNCFELLESKTIDRQCEGYLEAFTRSWGVMDDLRLSEKDLNFPKSQNTHLHVLEAYTTLNKVHPTEKISAALRYNIELFDKYIIDKKTSHLRMFMDHDWKDHSPGFTYGHDIEASWLIAKALESLGDTDYTQALMPELVKIADVTLKEGVGAHGHVIDAYDFASKTYLPDIVWWVQAEALVGFLFAYSESGEQKYCSAAENIWEFIKRYQIDKEHGEWFWSASVNGPQVPPYYKVGFWKCPYHNGRAMMEGINYLAKIL
ncbi:cellobiose 2-epimerase [Cellvibrio zantedeschiae]|uniref:Cellobiose 2-epimerase n=1 Tax=Cellvibrio zantedeschiae TaxID=1237077 RepID=A0ABQ3BDC7_9GAMM|nr:cellobiose 2-epimerase EpiA [Cellvibrio zantedeschiae]GGY87795.1 cellobiose 2-epimerase [Cellvibrio zantedeschiae]